MDFSLCPVRDWVKIEGVARNFLRAAGTIEAIAG
jgi:hypothetical protein